MSPLSPMSPGLLLSLLSPPSPVAHPPASGACFKKHTTAQVITPYECEYTVMLSPPSAPVVKESTGITMFIIDEMREAKEAKARLAKVIINETGPRKL